MNDPTPSASPEQIRQTLEALQKAADEGNPKAQFQLGMLYANGDEVELSYSKAADLIMAAASSGLIDAQSTLAWLYANGYGVQQDDQQAGYWYRKAAEQGSAKDEYMLGMMHRFGQLGGKRDVPLAIRWFQRAADKGFAPAQFALGKLIMDGKHVEQDKVTAFQWLALAHANGSKRAEGSLKKLMAMMTPEELQSARDTITGGN